MTADERLESILVLLDQLAAAGFSTAAPRQREFLRGCLPARYYLDGQTADAVATELARIDSARVALEANPAASDPNANTSLATYPAVLAVLQAWTARLALGLFPVKRVA
jgi:hypothetical protein